MQQPPQPPPPRLPDPQDDALLNLPQVLGPEHVQPVYETLLAALRVDPGGNAQPRREAEALLRAFEAVPHYTDVLCTIVGSAAADGAAHDDARLLALLCIQNVVHRHWRGGPGGLLTRGGSSGLMGMRRHLREAAAAGEAEEAGDPQRALFLRQLQREYVVGEEEKARLRAFLLGRMDEPNDRLAKNLAHVLARVVRADCPRRWPDFFPQLLEKLQLDDDDEGGGGSASASLSLSLQSVRVIQSLHRATKELAGKALLADKMAFQGMARLLFPVVYRRLWRPRTHQLLQALAALHHQQAQGQMEQVLALAGVAKTCTKILHFLVVQHADALDNPAELAAFLHDLHAQALPRLLATQRAFLTSAAVEHPLVPLLGRLAKHGGRLVVELQRRSPLMLVLPPPPPPPPPSGGAQQQQQHALSAFLELFWGELHAAATGTLAEALLWAGGEDASDPCRHFYLQACAFLGNVVGCTDYVLDEGEGEGEDGDGGGGQRISFEADGERPRRRVLAAQAAVQAFYTPARLMELCDLILERLLGLRPSDLEAWTDDPEEFLLEEEQRRPDDDVGAAAEGLFLALFDARRGLIGPKLAALLGNYDAQLGAAATATAAAAAGAISGDVLFWDRVYLVLGLASYALRDFIDLPAWFRACGLPLADALVHRAGAQQANNNGSNARPPAPPVLLRRLVYLVACSAHDVPRDAHPQLYHILAAALDPGNPSTDLMVALHAIDALQALVNDWEFATQGGRAALAPVLGPILASLFRVIDAARELASKSKALGLVALLITVMGDPQRNDTDAPEAQQGGAGGAATGDVILELAPHIVAPLPDIWASAAAVDGGGSGDGGGDGSGGDGDGGMLLDLRNGVMAVLIALLPRIGARAAQGYHPVLLPMLEQATDVRRPESLSLLEDGLRLWHVALTRTAAYEAQGMGALFPRLVQVLEHGFEHVKAVFLLAEDYTVLGGAPFLAQHLPAFLHCLGLALGSGSGGVADRGLGPVVRAAETLLVGWPEEGARALIDAGIADRLLQSSLGPPGGSSGSSSRGGSSSAGVSEATKVQFLSLLARALLTAPGVVLPYLQRLSVEPLVLADAMLALFDEVPSGCSAAAGATAHHLPPPPSSAPARRKLWCMALLFLLAGAGDGNDPTNGGNGLAGVIIDPTRRQALVLGMLGEGRLEPVVNVCLDALAEIAELEEERRRDQENGAAGFVGVGGGHVRGTGSGHLHGAEAAAYEEELLEELGCDDFDDGGGRGGTSTTYAPHPLVQAMVAARDPVAAADLKGCLRGALAAARAVAGEAAFEAAVRAVHPAVLEQMQRAVG